MPKPNWSGGASGAVSGATAGAPFGPWGSAIGGTIGAINGLYGGGGKVGRAKELTQSGMGSFRGNPNSGKGGGFMDALTGTDAQDYQQTTLGPEQIPLYEQSVNAGLNRGAGGAFGTSADYYRDLLSNNSEDMQAFMRPEMRQFNEQTIPGLAEQFAGMGSGGLSSSGFRNAAVGAGADLGERLGAIRANIRQQGAQGLQGIGQQGLNQYLENIHVPGQPGMLQGAANGIGQGFTQMAGNYLQGGGGGGGQPAPSGGGAIAPQSISRGGGVANNGGFTPSQMGIPRR